MRLTPRRHDALMARISHLPQLVSVALVNAAARGPGRHGRGITGPAFRDMSRVAVSSPDLWRGILATNRGELARALDDFQGEIRRLRRGLGRGAVAEFRRAARARSALLGGSGVARRRGEVRHDSRGG